VITVTKSFLAPKEEFLAYVDTIYETRRITNNGPLVQQLQQALKEYLGVEYLLLVTNGTLALQMAYRALDLHGTVITTPFSFVATASSISWMGMRPRFCDIDPETFCLDTDQLEELVTSDCSAIVPVQVFGNSCDIEGIEAVAKRHNLKVVYDASHAFGARYKGRSLLSYGDISTVSFHATKLFNTIEGGALIFKDKEVYERAKKLINFGITGPESIVGLGVNAKMNEFQAAMGLANLPYVQWCIERRGEIAARYREALDGYVSFQKLHADMDYNNSYMPVVFDTYEKMAAVKARLEAQEIIPRRYFYPSLDTLSFLEDPHPQPVSRAIADRILCLPLYPDLEPEIVEQIIATVRECR